MKLSTLKLKENNPRKIGTDEIERLKKSITDFPKMLELRPIIYDPTNFEVLAGNQRLKALEALGYKEIPENWVKSAENLTDDEKRRLVVVDNKAFGEWDFDILDAEFGDDLEDWSVDFGELGDIKNEDDNESQEFLSEKERREASEKGEKKEGILQARFIVPPFTALDTRIGYWLKRKKEWLNTGIASEVGRDENLLYGKGAQSPMFYDIKNELRAQGKPFDTDATTAEMKKRGYTVMSGTSIFDPVMCELAYRWFAPNRQNLSVLDPFSGGSVRGIVASKCGLRYTGVDLRGEQIEVNIQQGEQILSETDPMPTWICGDSMNIDTLAKGEYDLLFTCPPYGDLEVYSKDERDISNMSYDDFLKSYRSIIEKSCSMLRENSFAVIVTGNFRDKRGVLRDFVGDTNRAFVDAGLHYYNDALLINQIGNGAMRTRAFNVSRKLVRCVQYVSVFYKGDAREVSKHLSELDFSDTEIGIGQEDTE